MDSGGKVVLRLVVGAIDSFRRFVLSDGLVYARDNVEIVVELITMKCAEYFRNMCIVGLISDSERVLPHTRHVTILMFKFHAN